MSNSTLTLIASIRFHLSQLTSANAHHEFEHLARHLARARVYSNILPATGPVGAGGDGGRDFQTFRVRLSPGVATSSFGETSSGDRHVAFACSLEAKIEAKIRKDVKAILADCPADEIVYFCEANLPIGRRRNLQKWALTEHAVELNVFDGVAISEMLSEPDVFWIAQEYLRLPADLMPARVHDEDWYEALLKRWQNRAPFPVSQADFFDVKAGVRHATFTATAKPDLLMWIGKMEAFLDAHTPRPLARTALYELIVAHFRGRGEMASQRSRLEDYYSDFEEERGLADLQIAATLLLYAFTAQRSGVLDLDGDRLFAWRGQLYDLIDSEMARAPGPGRKAGLLRVRGHLGLLPPDAETPPDTKTGYADWRQMLVVASDAPLFPVESFADFLVDALKWGFDQEELLELAARTDDMLQARGGGEAGAKALARALILLDRDHYIETIRELHRAKMRWFSGDHLEGMLRVLRLLAFCYQQLGLMYAAKYYAMAAAYTASHEQHAPIVKLLPEALHAAADAEDAAGNSFGFLVLLLMAMDAHIRLDDDPMDPQKYPWINANLSQIAALVGLIRRGQPALEPALAAPLALWPDPLRAGALNIVADPDAHWNQGSWDEIWVLFQEATLDRPFGDLGPRRSARWSALGLAWTVSFDNTYLVTPIAEQFVAALQLALAAHAGVDLGLVPSDALIDVSIDAEAKDTTVDLDRDAPGGPRISVVIPADDRGEEQGNWPPQSFQSVKSGNAVRKR